MYTKDCNVKFTYRRVNKTRDGRYNGTFYNNTKVTKSKNSTKKMWGCVANVTADPCTYDGFTQPIKVNESNSSNSTNTTNTTSLAVPIN